MEFRLMANFDALTHEYVTIHVCDGTADAICPRNGTSGTKAPSQALRSVLFYKNSHDRGDHWEREPVYREKTHLYPTLHCFFLLLVEHNPLLNSVL